ncbi:hypothetical protein [Neisseria arctica]|uniref:hypothetical protein n=1 Tax=Neisseria arctica TaxID=1470200 RepID=UPI000A8A22DA|nr:hypothetical protein [Neisseria arctica]UOO87501.1 hypothetical protein LVJ86_04450 [Neisseria arctica]
MNYKPKHQVKVDGKMNAKDAGIVGKRLANAAIIFATLTGMAALLAAIAQFYK